MFALGATTVPLNGAAKAKVVPENPRNIDCKAVPDGARTGALKTSESRTKTLVVGVARTVDALPGFGRTWGIKLQPAKSVMALTNAVARLVSP